jgi:hypothetical protein
LLRLSYVCGFTVIPVFRDPDPVTDTPTMQVNSAGEFAYLPTQPASCIHPAVVSFPFMIPICPHLILSVAVAATRYVAIWPPWSNQGRALTPGPEYVRRRLGKPAVLMAQQCCKEDSDPVRQFSASQGYYLFCF